MSIPQACARLRTGWCCMWLAPILAVGLTTSAHADQIDDVVTARMSTTHIPGLSIAVLKNGKVVKVKGYGEANLELGTKAAPQTVYQIGSVSKQFVAAAVLKLVQEGKVGLEDPAGKYLEDVPQSWQPITIRRLLTHTAGLAREPQEIRLEAQPDIDVIRAGYALPLSYKPGDKMEYSNFGYLVLAEIITRTAGKPWPEYISEKIFEPLKMSATRTTTHEELVPNRASGYLWADGRYQNGATFTVVRPSGAFLSTVEDLAKWDAALDSDVLFTREQREQLMTAVTLNDGSTRPYGFGMELSKVGTHRLVRHAGTMLAFRAELSRYVDDGLTVIVLANSGQAPVEKVAARIAAFYIEDLQPRRSAVRMSSAELDAYTGKYQMAAGVLDISRRDQTLVLSMAQGSRSTEMAVLTPEAKDRFFDDDNPRPSYAFESDAQGRRQIALRTEDGREVMRATKLEPGK